MVPGLAASRLLKDTFAPENRDAHVTSHSDEGGEEELRDSSYMYELYRQLATLRSGGFHVPSPEDPTMTVRYGDSTR